MLEKASKPLHPRSKILKALALLFVFTLAFSWFAPAASASEIRSIDIRIELQDDGSANITEVWTVHATRGTELYLVKGHFEENGMSISDLKVTDELGIAYRTLARWNPKASFEEKAYRAGIVNTSTGAEICLGLSRYGTNTYTISYTFHNFLVAYSDGLNGFNQRVVNDKLSSAPEAVTVTIEKAGTPFTKDNTRIWAFGYDGQISLQDGRIVAQTASRLYSSDYVTIMASFDKEMFSPKKAQSFTFDYVKERALDGSGYAPSQNSNQSGSDSPSPVTRPSRITQKSRGIGQALGSFFEKIVIFLIKLFPLFFLFSISFLVRKAKNRRNLRKSGFQDVKALLRGSGIPKSYTLPFDGNLMATEYVLSQIYPSRKMQTLIRALLFRWLHKGYLVGKYKSGYLGVEFFTLSFQEGLSAPKPSDPSELQLFMMLKNTFDSQIEEEKLRKWAEENFKEIKLWYKKCLANGRDALIASGDLIETEEKFLFGLKKTKTELSTRGRLHIQEMEGFKKALTDQSTPADQPELASAPQLYEHLVFSVLLDIEEEAVTELRKVKRDPAKDDYWYDCTYYSLLDRSFQSVTEEIHSGIRSAESDSYDGGGGSSSSDGGGGFSGGDSGGGIR